MIFDLFKTTQLSAIGREVLNANKEIIDSVFATSEDLVKKSVKQSIDYNRAVLKTSAQLLTASQDEAKNIVESVTSQVETVASPAIDLIKKTTEQLVDIPVKIIDSATSKLKK